MCVIHQPFKATVTALRCNLSCCGEIVLSSEQLEIYICVAAGCLLNDLTHSESGKTVVTLKLVILENFFIFLLLANTIKENQNQ